MTQNKIKVAVIGASGYTGTELIRLLVTHPNVEVTALIADSSAGKQIHDLYPHLSNTLNSPELITLKQVNFTKIDVAFCCLPHTASQRIIKDLLSKHNHLKIIDLSADYRLRDTVEYEKWYGNPHIAPELQKEAVYGLTEIYREEIKNARLVACPGCYPTSILLPLIPLLEAGAISSERIIIDSKSGVTGAGRSAKIANLFTEVNENIRPYAIGLHRHLSEIEQELGLAANMADLLVTFTPQVVPISRGILSSIYVDLTNNKAVHDIDNILKDRYVEDIFINVSSNIPSTRQLSGTNNVKIAVFEDRVSGRAIILSAIDNLCKGSSGQAVQNMNIMFGLDEDRGLKQISAFP